MEITEITKLLLESRGSLHKYACSLTHDWQRADDLMQETAFAVLRKADSYTHLNAGGFYGWVCKIMYRIFINSLKYDERYKCVEEFTPQTIGLQPFANKMFSICDSDGSVRVDDIYRAIDRLPGEMGKVMRLLVDGRKYVEIAVMTKLPLGTVKSQIRLSREMLKRMLEDGLS